MPAISSVAALLANPGATFAAAAAATGDTLTVPSFPTTNRGFITGIIRTGATAGGVRVLSPRLHDNVRGITLTTDKARTVLQMPRAVGQPVYPGDTLAVQLTGGTAETDAAVLTMYYDNIPGVQARLATPDQVLPNVVNIKPVVVTLSGQTVGQWKTAALNATEDLLEAGFDYALLGVQTDAAVGAISIQGPDTGNYRIAAPGDDSTVPTGEFFVLEAMRHGLPMIPIINSNNKAATLVGILDHTTTQAPNVQLIFGQLSQQFAG